MIASVVRVATKAKHPIFSNWLKRWFVGNSLTSNFSQGRVQAMSRIPYEIPAEIRDLTAKSVEEARKAWANLRVRSRII